MAASMDHAEQQTKIIKHIDKTSREKRLIVILENASLETVKVRGSFNLRPCNVVGKANVCICLTWL